MHFWDFLCGTFQVSFTFGTPTIDCFTIRRVYCACMYNAAGVGDVAWQSLPRSTHTSNERRAAADRTRTTRRNHQHSACQRSHLLLRYDNTHTQPFYDPFFGTTLVSRCQKTFWTLWCKGRLTEANISTIQLGATPSGLTSAHLHHLVRQQLLLITLRRGDEITHFPIQLHLSLCLQNYGKCCR